MKKVNWLLVFGVSILIHIILIALSVLEVVIYSYFINKGQTKEFYEAHALTTAPIVATIAGFIVIYYFVVRLTKKKAVNPFLIGVGLPVVYIILDLIFMMVTTPDWVTQMNVFIFSNSIKLLAGMVAAYQVRRMSI